MTQEKEFLSCSRILAIMVILCFMFQYMLRVNISIAIVDMIAKNNSNTSPDSHPHFPWNEEEKNEILGSFFWGYLLMTIPGGRLSEIYGSKIVLGSTMLLASILTILTPFACNLHYYGAIVVRTALGLALGVFFPSLPPMVAKWIPPQDRSKFMSHSAAGYLGTALTLPLCGFLIAHLGWPSTFYFTGAVALIWALAWFYLIYDSPEQHPRISKEEKEALGGQIKVDASAKHDIPWRKLFTSKPVWAIIVSNTSLLFSLFFILSELPSYMKQVLDFKIETNGLLSSFPYAATYLAAIVSCYLADRWNKSKTFTLLTIRKIFTSLALFGPALLFFIQSFWGYNCAVSIVVFTLSLGFMGCFPAGFYSNCLDIAPAFAGTIFGVAAAFGSLAGYLSTKILSLITKEQQSFQQWRYIFWILIGVELVGAGFYLVYASGKVQSWNSSTTEAEMTKLNPEKECQVEA
jgi:ACS family sodium-dependent inorganic phosphate cotransporter